MKPLVGAKQFVDPPPIRPVLDTFQSYILKSSSDLVGLLTESLRFGLLGIVQFQWPNLY